MIILLNFFTVSTRLVSYYENEYLLVIPFIFFRKTLFISPFFNKYSTLKCQYILKFLFITLLKTLSKQKSDIIKTRNVYFFTIEYNKLSLF